jgi:hypothetical protein
MTVWAALLLSMAVPLGPAPDKKLIQWGAGSPNTRQFREQIAQMEKTPFDGTVISAIGRDGAHAPDLAWTAFGRPAMKREAFKEAVQDLKETKRTRFTDCFLRFNVTPGDVDFMDDAGWAAIVSNARLAAWVAHEGRLKGWMFDTEPYENHPFSYRHQDQSKTRSFEEYKAAARRRGSELIRAANSEFPDITILFTFTSTLAVAHRDKLPDSNYGLLPSFIDGIFEAATPQTVLVDANEFAYPSKTRKQLEFLFVHTHVGGRSMSAIPEIYDKRVSVGLEIWMDHDWRNLGWDPVHTERNHFQPQELRHILTEALDVSNRYVWLYSEKVNWFTGEGLSDAYAQAVKDARADLTTRAASTKPQ